MQPVLHGAVFLGDSLSRSRPPRLKILNSGCYGLTMTATPPRRGTPPEFLVRNWIQQIRTAMDVLYPPDEVHRADERMAAVRDGAALTEADYEAGPRWEARERVLQVADWLEQWVGPAPPEDQQSQERP
jgi:hypothetical protein